MTDEKQMTSKDSLDDYIVSIIKSEKPETVAELLKVVQQKFTVTQTEIMEHISQLEKSEKIKLKEFSDPSKARNYMFSSKAMWFWITTTLALCTTIAVFAIGNGDSPIVYVRYILGSLFIIYLPGYGLVRAIFPNKTGKVEGIVLSIVMSLSLVIITGFILNYTPFGIKLVPLTFSLLVLTLVFSIYAIVREQKNRLNRTEIIETR